MKKYLTILLLIFIFASCEEELKIYDNPEGFIQVTSTSGSLTEADQAGIITTVIYGGESNDSGITVKYTVTSSDPSRYTITPSTGTIEIPAGEFTAEILLNPIDNIDVDGDIEVTITLNPDSSKPVGLGGEALNFVNRKIKVIDDDCPIELENMVGKWTGTNNWAPANSGPDDTQIETTFDGTNFQIKGLGFGWLEGAWWGEVVVNSTPITLNIDLVTGEFTIPETYLADTTWNGSPQPTYRISGSGIYLACSNTMVIDYFIIQGGAALYSFQFTETVTLN